ncbi:MAG TPA: CPBP family intramembrane glutamic endopeptidase [Rhodanobacteraceae bacterium]|nr:CPBP family intramembrane glutamic endopeptidase [Rhodanobacteraceae bacterium]
MHLPTENPPPAAADPANAVPSANRPGVWSGLGTVALYFLLQLGLSLLIGMAIGFVLAVKAGVEAGLRGARPDTAAITQLLQTSPDLKVILTVATIAAAAAIMVLLVRQSWPAQWSRGELPGFGFTQPADKLVYVAAVVLGVGVLLLGGLLTHLLAGSHPIHQDVKVMAAHAPLGLRVLLALLVVCVAPIVEELVFRGVLLSGLASRMQVGWAIVASAVIFGCAHLPDFQFAWYPVPALVLLGLVLAWLRVQTRSLWPSITLHATNNFVAVLAWFVVATH